MTDAKYFIQNQIDLLKIERDQDFHLYQEKMLYASLEQRQKDGVTWYPVQHVQDFISTGERISLIVERTKNTEQRHAFQVGANVSVFSGKEEKGKFIQGVIGYLKENTMRIVLNQSSLPDWVYEERIGVNLLFDDNTYKDMQRALKAVKDAENNRLAELREIIYGNRSTTFSAGYVYDLPALNAVQNEAFAKIVEAKDLALVHGPPGTGKTTTLTKCIKETVRSEKQVLVCAPSNSAVDLLVEKLSNEGMDVLRIGHPARLTPEVIENSLDVKISNHEEFKRLRSLRQRSEEFRKLARKYKRQFGRAERVQRDRLFDESRALKQESKDLESYISESLLDRAEVIACTLTGSNHHLIKDKLFKTLFIDEASQALEAACWIPVARVQRVIMSGDHYQLPPTIKSREAAERGLEETMFSRAISKQPQSAIMLEEQYRMHPDIMAFSSKYFYKNKLRAAQSILKRNNRFENALEFIDTAGAGFDEKIKQETRSTYNWAEAKALMQIMERDNPEGMSIGLIAPYKAQVELLEREINYSDELAKFRDLLTINTVDAFQGQERDVMYISLVRSNADGQIGFLKEYRRTNVAITRAKYRLCLIGDSSTLANDPFYDELITHIQRNGKYSSVYEYQLV